jgi:hypothetical protein
MSTGRALLVGTLLVGTLDILDAFIFFGLRGVAPVRILQSIASGWLGKGAFTGGTPVAILGIATHYFIAFGIVATFLGASRLVPALARHPFVTGPLYGLAVYAVMNYVVIPLSAAASRPPAPPVLVNGLLIHMLGVGLPSALVARMALRAG